MARELKLDCADCRVAKYNRACDSENGAGPGGCPSLTGGETLTEAARRYQEPGVLRLARESSRQEAAGYTNYNGIPRPVKTRIEEICELARRMECRRLGLAFCGGLLNEAKLLARVLMAQGFEVESVVCKVGRVPKEELGLLDHEKIRPGHFESACNPIAQAQLLNHAGTELNIMMGLCVGHDALFLKHVEGYTTVLAVKDRVLCHNPMAALYTLDSYSSWLLPDQSP
jgi:uncharacterized metal-binding protein